MWKFCFENENLSIYRMKMMDGLGFLPLTLSKNNDGWIISYDSHINWEIYFWYIRKYINWEIKCAKNILGIASHIKQIIRLVQVVHDMNVPNSNRIDSHWYTCLKQKRHAKQISIKDHFPDFIMQLSCEL